MALQAAMKSTAAELWDGVAQAAHDVIERQQGAAPELDDDGLLVRGSASNQSVPCCGADVAPSVRRW